MRAIRRNVTSAERDIIVMISMRYVSDERAGTPNSLDDSLSGQQLLLDCGICGQKFSAKKQLRVHINTHLRKPRIVLKRITGPKAKVCTQSDTYWLDPETKGSLKLTLKKQSTAESLKLTLRKKSSESADFTVVHSNSNLRHFRKQSKNVAGAKEDDRRDDKPTENSVNEPFENVMVDQQVSSLLDVTSRELKFRIFYSNFVYRMIMKILNSTRMNTTILWKRMRGRP